MARTPAPVAPAPKRAASKAACSQNHTTVQDTDTTQFNMDKQTFSNICHECDAPFAAKAASNAK